MKAHWDSIVIGSGAGGLTAAAALSRSGQRVLVLEQHYLPGGWCHSFTLEGHLFSPGVHYISGCGPGGTFRQIYASLGLANEVDFVEMNPDAFDHIVVAGQRLDIPQGTERFIERLCEKFPQEREGIRKYFSTLKRLNNDIHKSEQHLGFPKVLQLPLKAPTLSAWGFRTLGALLDSTIRDTLLRDFLAAQSGNHGLAPSRVSLPMHAGMTMSYLEGGAYYPRGGARRLPRALIRELKRNGGEIRVKTRVEKILINRGRAIGVETSTGERIGAGHVISNADPAVTFGKLLSEDYGHRERRKLRRTEYSVSLLSLFCATDLNLAELGLDSGNWWWFRHRDVNAFYERVERVAPQDSIDGLFLSVPSLKDPSSHSNGHTLELFTFVPYTAFERWEGSSPETRAPDYERYKEKLGDLMIAAAEEMIPGLSRALTFKAVGTPLTNNFYCETYRGAIYGTAKTPWQLGPFSFSPQTSVDGLWLCGASTLSHGVTAASMSGLMVAKEILKLRSVDDLLQAAA